MAGLSHGIRNGFLIFIAVVALSACGGGGSDAPADTVPEAFSFTSLSDQEPSATITSNTETITGINRSLAISIVGGEFSINGGAFTSEDATIRNGQTLQLRAVASSDYETSVTITVTLGDNPSEDFVITTRAKDETPEDFSFVAATNQDPGASVTSTGVTITGIDSETPISVENGQFSLDNGSTFESIATTIDAGQTVILQGDASTSYETTTSVTLTVGTESQTFSITTRSKDITPSDFEFTAATGQEINTLVTSNSVTITGIDEETNISIENGTYSLDAGETFIDTPSTINADQDVIVRVTTSSEYEADATATLTVGTEIQNFVATTRAKNITPTSFSITAATNQNLDVDVSSAAFTVTGFDPATAISIANGSYSLDGGSSFTTDASTIDPGQDIIVAGRSSSSYETTTQVLLTVGTVTETFAITTRERDITPENLGAFTAVTDGDPSTAYTSNALTVADIEGEVSISISNGTYDINESGVFVSEAGTIESGQTVRVQATTSAAFDTPVVATLSVGTESRDFSVTAIEDSTPAALGLTETVSELDLNEVVTRGPFTVSEINTSVSISIENGEYEIVGSGEGFVSTAGQVEEGDQINVRATAPNAAADTLLAILTVGTLSETLTLETVADNTVPEAAIAFPPPISMTEGGTVTVRGTASDDVSPVTVVRVNGVDATDTSDDGSFATWQVQVPLAEGSNDITVAVTDGADNTAGNAASVSIVRDSAMGDFPNSDNPLIMPTALALDYKRNRLIIGDREQATLFAVDLSTGVRTPFSDNSSPTIANSYIEGMLIIESEMPTGDDRLFFGAAFTDRVIYEVTLSDDAGVDGDRIAISSPSAEDPGGTISFVTPFGMLQHPTLSDHVLVSDSASLDYFSIVNGSRYVFSTNGTAGRSPLPEGDTSNSFGTLHGMVLDEFDGSESRNRLLTVSADTQPSIMSVSVADGSRTPFSGNSVPNSNAPLFSDPRTLIIDPPRNRILVNDAGLQSLVAVALSDDENYIEGERAVFSDITIPNAINAPDVPEEIFYDDRLGYAFWADSGLDAVFAVDIISGERVFITRGVTP